MDDVHEDFIKSTKEINADFLINRNSDFVIISDKIDELRLVVKKDLLINNNINDIKKGSSNTKLPR